MRKKTQRIVMAVLAGIMALLMLLPIALIFSDNSMANLQTVSIIAAFPIGIIILLIIGSFFKDAKAYLKEHGSITRLAYSEWLGGARTTAAYELKAWYEEKRLDKEGKHSHAVYVLRRQEGIAEV